MRMVRGMTDTIYFNAASNSKSSDFIKEWQASSTKHRKAISAFCDKHGIKGRSVSSGNEVSGFCPAENQNWGDFIRAMPEWRRIKSRGCDYVVPRKIHKELCKEWFSIPMPNSIEWLGANLTGLDKWTDWLIGMSKHHIGLAIRDDGSAVIAIEYLLTKKDKFKPADGLVMPTDQSPIRDEWHDRMSK
jgi:hypothetical protein